VYKRQVQSSAVNPVHSYTRGGEYTVTLTVSGPRGESRVVATNLVNVYEGAWIDGQNITGDFADAEAEVFQNTVTDWGMWNALLAMRGRLESDQVVLGISGSVERSPNRNGVVIFFDVNPATGTNVLLSWLSATNVAWRIKNMVGMRFDTVFTPDYALNINIDDTGNNAYVDFSDLVRGTYVYWGQLQNLHVSYGYLSNGQVQIAFYDQQAAGTSLSSTGTYATGIEMALRMSALGGTTDRCWVQALLINNSGSWSANQSLPPINGDTNGYAVSGATGAKRYDLVPGEQFMILGIPEPGMWTAALAMVLMICRGRAWRGVSTR
ncbi:MAG: hypothetical protein N2595_03300, partial [bacterium]|nr:hypothetical protein [bacterium]